MKIIILLRLHGPGADWSRFRDFRIKHFFLQITTGPIIFRKISKFVPKFDGANDSFSFQIGTKLK